MHHTVSGTGLFAGRGVLTTGLGLLEDEEDDEATTAFSLMRGLLGVADVPLVTDNLGAEPIGAALICFLSVLSKAFCSAMKC